MNRIGVVGAGNFGTVLAKLLTEKFGSVTIWAYEPDVVKGINEDRLNPRFLKGVHLPKGLHATDDIREAVANKDFVLSVVPSKHLRGVWKHAAAHIGANTVLISCTKGIEETTLQFPHEILAEELPHIDGARMTFLSGPSFAKEIARDMPTGVCIAGTDRDVASRVRKLLRTTYFLTYTHDDVIGVEIAGAVKNVIAIAAGTSEGLGFGDNTRVLTIERGHYEMKKLGICMGADPDSFGIGLAASGDLYLTASAKTSRNFSFGYALGKGAVIDRIIKDMEGEVPEGFRTSIGVYGLIRKHQISAPICEAVYHMLHEGLAPEVAVTKLLDMQLGEELGGLKRLQQGRG